MYIFDRDLSHGSVGICVLPSVLVALRKNNTDSRKKPTPCFQPHSSPNPNPEPMEGVPREEENGRRGSTQDAYSGATGLLFYVSSALPSRLFLSSRLVVCLALCLRICISRLLSSRLCLLGSIFST